MHYVAVDINKDTPDEVTELVLAMELREIDLIECALVGSKDSLDSIILGILNSGLTYCKAGFNTITGLPEFIFGVAATDNPIMGSPWMLATEDFKITKDWLKMCKGEVFPEMEATFPILSNFVHKDNQESIQWLRWLGFSFYDVPVTFTDDQTEPVPMYLFTKLGGSPICVPQQQQ
jgi:hypothetical protein